MARAGRAVRASEPPDLLAYSQEEDTSWLLPYVDVISLLPEYGLTRADERRHLRRSADQVPAA